jgi:hypothetical protein
MKSRTAWLVSLLGLSLLVAGVAPSREPLMVAGNDAKKKAPDSPDKKEGDKKASGKKAGPTLEYDKFKRLPEVEVK